MCRYAEFIFDGNYICEIDGSECNDAETVCDAALELLDGDDTENDEDDDFYDEEDPF